MLRGFVIGIPNVDTTAAAWAALFASLAACSWFEKAPTGPDSSVRERWTQSQPGFAFSKPVVTGTAVIFGTGNGQLIARSQSTGDELWRTKVSDDRITGAHLISRGDVVVAAALRSVHAVDATTGRPLWSYMTPLDSIGDENPRPGLVFGAKLDQDASTVFVPAWGASVSAIDLQSGSVRWIWRPPAGTPNRTGSMGVRVSGDTVLATVWHFLNESGTRSESWLVALDRDSGRELWILVLPASGIGVDIQGAPALSGRLALVNTGNGQLFAVDRFTRAIVWQTSVADTHGAALSQTVSSPAIDGETVYHDAGSGDLYARRVSDGTLLWKTKYGADFVGDLTVTAGRVYGSTFGYLHVFDRTTGRLVAELQQPRTSDPVIASAPAFKGKQLFVNVNGAAWSFDEP